MATTAKTIQQKVHQLADELPPGATWDDVLEEIHFRKAVEAGIAAADRGVFASDKEVHEAFTQWGVKP
jgi:predicted transcriptional regulator